MPGDEEKDDLRTLGPFSILHYSNSWSLHFDWLWMDLSIKPCLRIIMIIQQYYHSNEGLCSLTFQLSYTYHENGEGEEEIENKYATVMYVPRYFREYWIIITLLLYLPKCIIFINIVMCMWPYTDIFYSTTIIDFIEINRMT